MGGKDLIVNPDLKIFIDFGLWLPVWNTEKSKTAK